ncbi:hypothetical protein ALQ50_04997 [Pseudomonas coronafaciens pv. coronafaciens]|nr:Unknown protein sequence [Pseudomonas coronafaciens pv. oryzae]KPY25585.1 hypothetical protein ALO89_04299 [Pseudomonas coronafaciens pv. porri]KPZ23442.1 hypothetical protein ALO38_05248 [Pseudomonas coronafaciens pv. zizaniae]RMN95423.1 hypothetical protein ALQ50_04997 [Pseudomonas coronafaciens pv. coronafaciens]RMP27362.1 hypothetical protein ALQ25_04521 [Pseudomonas coronafaciens pv. atropurpurea]RMS13313.1 hypothetical protein ALP71_03766 [Pseudomonas coronafaciens pv. garcae]
MKPAADNKPTAIAPTVMSAFVSFYAAFLNEQMLVDWSSCAFKQ